MSTLSTKKRLNKNYTNNTFAYNPAQSSKSIDRFLKSKKTLFNTELSNCNYTNRDYSKYDVQKLTYEINKEYSNIKIPKEKNFDERMKFYALKKQIKEKKLNELLKEYKVKISEKDKQQTFNNLLQDTNRRYEAKRIIQVLVDNGITDENYSEDKNKSLTPRIYSKAKSVNAKKKVSPDKWEDIYRFRFKEKEYIRNEKLKLARLEKESKRFKLLLSHL